MNEKKRFTLTIPIRFRDLDAMGHVNNATFLTYFEEGRKEFFIHVLKSSSPKDFPFILAQVTCQYLRPIELDDKIVQETVWISRIGKKASILPTRFIVKVIPHGYSVLANRYRFFTITRRA